MGGSKRTLAIGGIALVILLGVNLYVYRGAFTSEETPDAVAVPSDLVVAQAAPVPGDGTPPQPMSATQQAPAAATGDAKEKSTAPSPEEALKKHIRDADEDLAEEMRETNAMAELRVAITLRDAEKRAARLKDIVERYAGTQAAKMAARLLSKFHRGESTT